MFYFTIKLNLKTWLLLKKLSKIQASSSEKIFMLPKDPLDLDLELGVAHRVFDHFEI